MNNSTLNSKLAPLMRWYRNRLERIWERGSHHSPDTNPWWREPLSWQAASFVTEHSKHKGSYLLTLIMIANHAHADGTGAWPSIATLAKETRMSERGVQYCLQKL